MKKITLHIETPGESKTVSFEDEITIGRTDASQIVLDDSGLSRKNTTFFRDGEFVLIVDENSTNGTFVNGERVSGEAKRVFDGDKIKIGSETNISVEIVESREARVENQIGGIQSSKIEDQKPKAEKPSPKSQIPNPKSEKPPFILMASAGSIFLIVFLGLIIFLVARSYEGGGNNGNRTRPPTAQLNAKLAIPIRVIDPLGGEDPDDIDDLISSWEVFEEPLEASDIEEIKTVSTDTPNQPTDLKVSVEYWQAQMNKARNHPGVNEPLKPVLGTGIAKQKTKLAELISRGYKQPLDFADLAELHMKGTLVELPMATEHYVLEVGGSATEEEFKSFEWDANGAAKVGVISPGTPKYQILQQLANNFHGQKYDLNNGRDRKQMRIRLLRMYHPKSRKLFEEICKAYSERFKVPLRISSLTRSMDYQILLNKTNANSFRVSAQNALAPHTSGCAFDLPRSTLSSGEQNFVMAKLAELKNAQNLDSIMEGGANACFHTFIYPDGVPAQSSTTQAKK